MNINTDFIPVETSTTSSTSTTTPFTTATTTTMPWEYIQTPIMADITTTGQDYEYPPGVKRENIIKGLSELEKDIFIISLSGLVLILTILLVVICLKWRKSKVQTYEFHNMSAGSSMSVFNSSKID